VCCLSSLNLEKYFEWKDDPRLIEDVMRFLDNVLQDFIDNAPESMSRAAYAAMRERSVGLGVMGFHSFLQVEGVPFESVMAKVWNKKMFAHVRTQADAASKMLAAERGACPDAADYGVDERFSNKMAIAPTASISIICGGTSPGIEPIAANSFTHKTLSGSFNVRNRFLKALLAERGEDTDEVWSSITTHEGSVQHLDFLTENEKAVFKTAFELDQRWIIELAADRSPFICQSQSVNVFLPADVHKKTLHDIHFEAWKKGMKSLYYCRSKSLQRAEAVATKAEVHDHGAANGNGLGNGAGNGNGIGQPLPLAAQAGAASGDNENDYEECLSCQ
jgi:ribonucleoside-diphosphate reductase alpha chain